MRPSNAIHIIVLAAALGAPLNTPAQQIEARTTPPVLTDVDPTALEGNIERESARWQLTETEYRRYLALMRGPRGSFSAPTISPIEVLGIHAKTPAERARYAERWVDMIKADTARVLRFQNTVHEVWRRKHPDEPLINRGRVNRLRLASDSKYGPLKVNQAQESLVGRTMFFTRADCGVCDRLLRTALEMLDSGRTAGVDIYLSGVPRDDDQAIQSWARDRTLSIQQLGNRSLTLNYDLGVSAAVAGKVGQSVNLPFVVQRRGEHYQLLVLNPS